MPKVPISSGRVEKGGSPAKAAVGAVPLASNIRATSAVSMLIPYNLLLVFLHLVYKALQTRFLLLLALCFCKSLAVMIIVTN